MFKQMFESPGHIPSVIAATAAGVASGSAAVALGVYFGGRALGAAIHAPSDEEIAESNRQAHEALNENQFGKK